MKRKEPFLQCSRCDEVKGLSAFPTCKRAPFGVRTICRTCSNKKANENYHKRQAYYRELIAATQQNKQEK